VATRVLTACVAIGVLAAIYLTASRQSSRAPSEMPLDVPATEQPAPSAAAAVEALPVATEDDTVSAAEASLTERASGLKRMASEAVANRHRAEYVEQLVAKGLSPSDSESIVQTLFDALAECHFDATRRRYEAYGLTLEQFVSGAEEVWNNTPSDSRSVSVDAIAKFAPECVALAGQNAGIPIAVEASGDTPDPGPEDFGILAEPNLLAQPATETLSPGWADQMELKIRHHIERYPNIVLTDLRIKCEDRGCVVLLRGEQISIFELEFDRFAEENGFASALPYGDEAQRTVWLLK
jgi:hypothetical protein